MNLHIDKVKKLICATACAAVLSSTLSAAAAEPVTPDTFDYEQYADRYPDLKQNLGYDKNLLWYYYETYGKEEGRMAGGIWWTAPGTTLSTTIMACARKSWHTAISWFRNHNTLLFLPVQQFL